MTQASEDREGVEEEDVIVTEHNLSGIGYFRRILYGIMAGLAGLFGAIYLSLGLGFFDVNLVFVTYFLMSAYGYLTSTS